MTRIQATSRNALYLPAFSLLVVMLLLGLGAESASAQAIGGGKSYEPGKGLASDVTPQQIINVGVDEKLESLLPLDAKFLDENGNEVELGSYFQGDRPVILNIAYYGCPMLCGLVTNGLVESLQQINWTPGDQYEVVTISIDPREGPKLAAAKKLSILDALDREGAEDGWHFLTGSEEQINRVTDAVGFNYQWNQQQQEYAHAAVIVLASPQGKVTRYLYGIKYPPKTLRLSLVESSEGKTGSTMDKVLLYCFQYDPDANSYSLAAYRLMQAGGAVTVVIMLLVLVPLWLRDARGGNQPPGGSSSAAEPV